MSDPTESQRTAAAVAKAAALAVMSRDSDRPDPRWSSKELRAIDAWRAKQSEPLGRSEAIRRLVEIALKAKQKS